LAIVEASFSGDERAVAVASSRALARTVGDRALAGTVESSASPAEVEAAPTTGLEPPVVEVYKKSPYEQLRDEVAIFGDGNGRTSTQKKEFTVWLDERQHASPLKPEGGALLLHDLATFVADYRGDGFFSPLEERVLAALTAQGPNVRQGQNPLCAFYVAGKLKTEKRLPEDQTVTSVLAGIFTKINAKQGQRTV
jgi:hypothetical protein